MGAKGNALARPASLSAALLCSLLAVTLTSGCSIKRYAINKLGDSLAKAEVTFASDNDPDLIRDALPFSLKLVEALLAESPRHRGLLLAGASGFTQYAFAFIQEEADERESRDLAAATALRVRARRLYLRARDYGLRGLEVRHRGIEQALRTDPQAALQVTKRADVPLLYWTAAAWGLAITLSKDDPETVADQPIVEALIDRALALEEDFGDGALHAFLITYEPNRPGGGRGAAERARKHFARAMELTRGQLASPLVALAETVSVNEQNRAEFEQLLQRALEINPDTRPEWRLANLIMQRRARWLLARVDELFLE